RPTGGSEEGVSRRRRGSPDGEGGGGPRPTGGKGGGPPVLARQQELGDRVPTMRPQAQALLDGRREPDQGVLLEQPQHSDILPRPLAVALRLQAATQDREALGQLPALQRPGV